MCTHAAGIRVDVARRGIGAYPLPRPTAPRQRPKLHMTQDCRPWTALALLPTMASIAPAGVAGTSASLG
jgi:hypothetical protein